MKEYIIKYETYDREVKMVTIVAYDIYVAESQLINCRQIYWIKSKMYDTGK